MPAGPAKSTRVAIVGASSLRGRELKLVLEERNFPASHIVDSATGYGTAAASGPESCESHRGEWRRAEICCVLLARFRRGHRVYFGRCAREIFTATHRAAAFPSGFRTRSSRRGRARSPNHEFAFLPPHRAADLRRANCLQPAGGLRLGIETHIQGSA